MSFHCSLSIWSAGRMSFWEMEFCLSFFYISLNNYYYFLVVFDYFVYFILFYAIKIPHFPINSIFPTSSPTVHPLKSWPLLLANGLAKSAITLPSSGLRFSEMLRTMGPPFSSPGSRPIATGLKSKPAPASLCPLTKSSWSLMEAMPIKSREVYGDSHIIQGKSREMKERGILVGWNIVGRISKNSDAEIYGHRFF